MVREKIVKFTPAFDRRSKDESKNYGIGAMTITFYLKGELAVVQFKMGTSWYLPGIAEELMYAGISYEIPETRPDVLENIRRYKGILGGRETRKVRPCDAYSAEDSLRPKAWDLGYHSPVALYEDQSPIDDNCEILGGKCYYEGSSLNAENMIPGFLAGGSDWLWGELEEYLDGIEERVKEQQELGRRFP